MNNWIRRSLLGALGAAIAFGGLAACGHRYGFGGAPGHAMSAEERAQWRQKAQERIASRLELNEAQKQRLAVLADKLAAQRAALVPAGSDPRADVRALVAGERFDRARAQALAQQKIAALNAGSPEVIAAFGDFYDSLNPTQQSKVREFLERRRRGWGWRS